MPIIQMLPAAHEMDCHSQMYLLDYCCKLSVMHEEQRAIIPERKAALGRGRVIWLNLTDIFCKYSYGTFTVPSEGLVPVLTTNNLCYLCQS